MSSVKSVTPMGIAEIRKRQYAKRRERLLELLKERSQTDLADAIARGGGPKSAQNPSYINRLARGGKNMTDDMARAMEQALKLPEGWFDGDTLPGEPPKQFAPALPAYPKMIGWPFSTISPSDWHSLDERDQAEVEGWIRGRLGHHLPNGPVPKRPRTGVR